ncbi:hypothetical protein EON81_21470 [bacterium]|nr:MAG: hypothetical protein EON81_21470 [bacterium]
MEAIEHRTSPKASTPKAFLAILLIKMLRMWTYDLAREQHASREILRELAEMSIEAGYDSLGLYLEHRFAYPSTPWSHGKDALTPDDVRWLQEKYRGKLKIVPFLNLLGHFEGMLYTEEGRKYAEERFAGMQANPTDPAFIELAEKIVDDTLAIFESEIVHIGGDETSQLGAGKGSRERVDDFEASGYADGKAQLYAEHFGPLAQRVLDAGRRPAVWGDMFFDHPSALEAMPKETLIFDWQYFRRADATARFFIDQGFETVLAPTIHTYNALWCHLAQTERNVREHVETAHALGAAGVCVTTWEQGLFGNYETLLPAIRGCGRLLNTAPETIQKDLSEVNAESLKGQGGPEAVATYAEENDASVLLREYLKAGEQHETWARLMGIRLQEAGDLFAFSGTRSSIKCRLLLYSNPFLLWLRDRDALLGEPGVKASEILNEALSFAPDAAYRGVTEFGMMSLQFVRSVEDAAKAYADEKPGLALTKLSVCRQVFQNLEKIAKSTHFRFGGSLADVERCRTAQEHVERVMRRIKQYGAGELGYQPSFETICHPKFVPHDQGNWWLINKWANE